MPSTRVEISDTAVSPDHFIGGKRVSSSATFEVRSPLDWEWHLADVARGDPLTVDQAITGGEFAELVRAMRNGATYVNVHSINHGSGEIRGNLRR